MKTYEWDNLEVVDIFKARFWKNPSNSSYISGSRNVNNINEVDILVTDGEVKNERFSRFVKAKRLADASKMEEVFKEYTPVSIIDTRVEFFPSMSSRRTVLEDVYGFCPPIEDLNVRDVYFVKRSEVRSTIPRLMLYVCDIRTDTVPVSTHAFASRINLYSTEYEKDLITLDINDGINTPIPTYPEEIDKANAAMDHEPITVEVDTVDTEVSEELTGASTNYYKTRVDFFSTFSDHKPTIVECEDMIIALELTFQEANIFKEIWRTAMARKGVRKVGHTAIYAAEKIANYANLNLRIVKHREGKNIDGKG